MVRTKSDKSVRKASGSNRLPSSVKAKGTRKPADIQRDKIKPIEKAILKVLPHAPEAMAFDDLVDHVAKKVNPLTFPLRRTVSRYAKVVQLDLEARGIIERLPGVSPIRLRKAR